MSSAYRVRAHNSARESENRIHDDAVARQFGFTGGLVPGVEVYAYMTHVPVERWGRAWLEHGFATCRFARPVYEDDDLAIEPDETEDRLQLSVRRGDEVCATGEAKLATEGTIPEIAMPHPPPLERPSASEDTLAIGTLLGMRPLRVTPEIAAQHRDDVRETAAIYAREGLMHPGMVLRTCNWVLTHNVVLGPWIHVGSTVRHLGAGRVERDAIIPRPCHRQLRAQGTPVRRTSRAGHGRRSADSASRACGDLSSETDHHASVVNRPLIRVQHGLVHSFANCRMREDGVDQLGLGALERAGNRVTLDHLRHFRAHHMRAQ